jgi:hypothetical protein
MTTHHTDYPPLTEEFCQSLSRIFNISVEEVRKYSFLFNEVENNIKNCLYHLSQIEEEDIRISAAFCLEYLVKFKESPL